jgi:GMP synthase (glutamine-hydrolysing)
MGIPILGICYGMQWVAKNLGGRVEPAERREYGPAQLNVHKIDSHLFKNFPDKMKIWNSHGDSVHELPPGFHATGRTSNAIAAAEDPERKIYTVQFHPEVNHTDRGTEILRNFLFTVCKAEPKWSGTAFIQETVEAIRARVGTHHAICGLSGGVDSTVAAVLVHRAMGDHLTNIFVNTGMLRKNEFEHTLEMYRDRLGLRVVGIDASEHFLNKLKGVSDPEKKRKIIGGEFIAVFAAEAQKLQKNEAHGDIKFLVQGTLYPDVIESVSVKGPSATIKTHHNVGGLPSDIPFGLIEPLRDLFKDEVRRIGKELGLPQEILVKHPFPGPGLAVRLLGEITSKDLITLREADAIVVEEIRGAGLYEKVWQAFAVLLPVRSVGVMGDGRTYGLTVAVRVVQSDDAMTADWVRLPGEVLERISTRIVNEVPGVTRVVYDVSSKPPSTIEWE